MRYSYEYKIKCVEMYRSGQWPETPDGCRAKTFRKMIRQWVRKYKIHGYNGLVTMKSGRPAKESVMKKKNMNQPRKLTETEYEELIRLRAENEYIKAENAVIKKEIALREEKQAALLKAKKQQSSKSSAKKGTN